MSDPKSSIFTADDLRAAAEVTAAQEHLAESMREQLGALGAARAPTADEVIEVVGQVAAEVVKQSIRAALARLGL